VGHNEDVHLVLDIVPGILIISIIQLTVSCIVLLRDWLSQVSINIPARENTILSFYMYNKEKPYLSNFLASPGVWKRM
jgi:hypothetical protein